VNGGAAAGLVTSQTTGKLVVLDHALSRLRKLRRAILTAARMHAHELAHVRHRVAMLTLTYRDVGGWNPEHVSELLRHVRMWLKRRGHAFRYVWVAELQQRGALHYHILVWLPKGLTLPKPDKQGWWSHGSTKIEWAKRAVGYLAKYASKLESKSGLGFPRGARLHGKGGLAEFGRSICQWWALPGWAREVCDLAGRAVRRKGCGLVERTTGVLLPSPWRVSRCDSGAWVARQLFTYSDRLPDVGGPFSWVR